MEISSRRADYSNGPAALGWKNWANLIAYAANFGVTYGSLTGIFGPTNTTLSAKYQTLVTPAGWAFAIWGPIFIWEGVFAVAQMLPSNRNRPVVDVITPWWLAACAFQIAWTFFFAQERIVGALVCMLSILVCLLGGILSADRLPEISVKDFWLLRAPFSLHGGWIVAASAVNFSVLADYLRGSPEVMLAVAIASFAGVAANTALFAVASPRGDPVVCFVAAWALGAVSSELVEAKLLKDPTRFNYYDWPQLVLDSLHLASLSLSVCCLAIGLLAVARRLASPKSKGLPLTQA